MKTTTLEAPAASTLHTERNVRTFGPRAVSGYGPNAMLTATVRYDDTCGNGYNSFAITGEIVTHASKRRDDCEACGMLHDDIARVFPELAPFLKWHGCSSDEPMHYIANSLYWAGKTKWEKGNLENFRSTAVWPEATAETLALDDTALTSALLCRLPELMHAFRVAVETLHFVF